MADELILPATVKDNFSKPLKDLSERLKNLKPSPNMRAMEKHFVDLRKRIDEAGRAIKDAGSGLIGGLGLGGLSIGALSAAGAMAALGASVKTFAINVVDMRRFSQETGIAAQKLKELKAVSAGLGIDEGALQGGLRFGAANYAALKRGQGNYADIANLRGGGASIANELRNAKSADDYTERGLAILNRQKTAEQRRVLSEKIFGTEEFASFGAQGAAALAKRRAAARSSIGGQSKDDEANAEKFLDASSKISASIEKLTNAVGGALAPHITQLAEALNKFGNEHMGDVQGFFDDVGKALRNHDWKADGVAINSALESVKAFFNGLNDFQKGVDDAAQRIHKSLESAFGKGRPEFLKKDEAKPGQVYQDEDGTIRRKEGTQATPQSAPRPESGARDDYSPIAYRPGARMAAAGIASAANSMAVATIAAGVLKGMTDFAATLQGGGDAAGGVGGAGGGSGVVQAAYHPGGGARSALGGMKAVRSAVGAAIKKYKDADYNVPDGTPGQYRPVYKLSDADLSDDVVNIINGEATSSILSTDAVINNMFNRLGTKAYGPSSNLNSVATAPGQYAGKSKASAARAAFIRDRIRAIASGSVPDVTNGSNEYRAGWYNGPWGRKHADSPVIGGNRFARNPKVPPGPYAPYDRPSASAARDGVVGKNSANGRVDIHVHSKDQPVDMKTNKSPLFGETKLNRGKSVGLMDI